MAMTPSQIGARAEAAVATALTAQGWIVYLPAFASHGRVDLVFADAAGLHGVQCKAARRVGDVLCFRTCSNTNNDPRAYGPEVEFFGVYFHERNQVFLVPVAGTPARECSLRLAATRNAQAARVRWADEYLVGRGV